MAEGWLNHFGKSSVSAFSAGTHPSFVHPLAIQIMKEAGVDISSHHSKGVDAFGKTEFDYVVTVCDSAKENCPHIPGRHTRIHMPFDDPAVFRGPEEERLLLFRRVRDEIRDAMESLHKNIIADL